VSNMTEKSELKIKLSKAAAQLKKEFEKLDDKSAIVRSKTLGALYGELKTLPPEERGVFGKQVNELRATMQFWVENAQLSEDELPPLDVSAPFDVNAKSPQLLPAISGSKHPLMVEMEYIVD